LKIGAPVQDRCPEEACSGRLDGQTSI